MTESTQARPRLPRWMKMNMPKGESYSKVKNLVGKHGLHTICSSGNCPNIGECWNRGTATFMILGEICTRNCKFCGVKSGKPLPVDPHEGERVAESIRLMQLKHAVVTSVDRDDLPDLGASAWVRTINQIKTRNPHTKLEVLIPDFQGRKELVQQIIDAQPEVISHNLETVERLSPQIRSVAQYRQSLEVLRTIAQSGCVAKSGIMLGLGETEEEVLQTMDDLLATGCKVMTIGQYLAPTPQHLPVVDYIQPEQFEKYRTIGLEKGFSFVESSPLVRSSYRAELHAGA
ncbi:lipoyl synthase [Mangrovibacterium marinum]|uniref:Lipoyl synthase n=1 Tax=Mangrovibacterium marinum TaxID=1639118 RepID=A0A2T5BYD2_9BACT|nr:lipoyl synthase [Mangrovibacterium marinum]PTN07237.1 lipoic acid synthetase [Mangrovibacterium marinum]